MTMVIKVTGMTSLTVTTTYTIQTTANSSAGRGVMTGQAAIGCMSFPYSIEWSSRSGMAVQTQSHSSYCRRMTMAVVIEVTGMAVLTVISGKCTNRTTDLAAVCSRMTGQTTAGGMGLTCSGERSGGGGMTVNTKCDCLQTMTMGMAVEVGSMTIGTDAATIIGKGGAVNVVHRGYRAARGDQLNDITNTDLMTLGTGVMDQVARGSVNRDIVTANSCGSVMTTLTWRILDRHQEVMVAGMTVGGVMTGHTGRSRVMVNERLAVSRGRMTGQTGCSPGSGIAVGLGGITVDTVGRVTDFLGTGITNSAGMTGSTEVAMDILYYSLGRSTRGSAMTVVTVAGPGEVTDSMTTMVNIRGLILMTGITSDAGSGHDDVID